MSTWNHRIVRAQYSTEVWYGIHEAYYDDNGKVVSWTMRPVEVAGNSIQELRKTLEQMLECLDKEVIDDSNEEMKFDATKWGFIEAMNYNERGYKGCREWLQEESDLSYHDIQILGEFVYSKVNELNTRFLGIVRCGSDDTWSDVRYQVVANGEEFYNTITAEKIQSMIDNMDYKESFAYSFLDF